MRAVPCPLLAQIGPMGRAEHVRSALLQTSICSAKAKARQPRPLDSELLSIFAVTEQKLDRSEIAGPPIDQRGFRPAQRMRAVKRRV